MDLGMQSFLNLFLIFFFKNLLMGLWLFFIALNVFQTCLKYGYTDRVKDSYGLSLDRRCHDTSPDRKTKLRSNRPLFWNFDPSNQIFGETYLYLDFLHYPLHFRRGEGKKHTHPIVGQGQMHPNPFVFCFDGETSPHAYVYGYELEPNLGVGIYICYFLKFWSLYMLYLYKCDMDGWGSSLITIIFYLL